MRACPSRRGGFGLVELMVSVTLVAILAVAAIPEFLDMRRKALRAEVLPHLRAMSTAQQAHFAASGEWLPLPANPAPPVASDLRPLERTGTWLELGWHPEGEVRCSYSAILLDGGAQVRNQALCDLDRNQQVAILRMQVASPDEPGHFFDVFPERY